MKLNKLTSAVSVSLLAVALTACGSSKDDAPIINTTPTTTTTPVVDNSAKLAQITANAKAAGLSDAAAAAFAAANVGLDIGSEAYQKALAEALARQNAANNPGTNNVTSPVVVTVNPFIKGVDASKNPTVTANQYTRQEGSTFDRRANPSQFGGLGEVGIDDPTLQNPYLSNYVLAVEATTNAKGEKEIIAIDSTGEMVKKGSGHSGLRVANTESPYATSKGLQYETDSSGGVRSFHYGLENGAATTGFKNFNDKANLNPAGATAGVEIAQAKDADGKIHTIQEINKGNVEIGSTIAGEAYTAAKTPADITRNDANGKVAGRIGQKSGLVVYTHKSVSTANGDYKVPSFGAEENTYVVDRNGNLVIANAVTKMTAANFADLSNGAGDDNNPFSREITPKKLDLAAAAAKFEEGYNGKADEPADDKDKAALRTAVANNFETRVFGKNFDSYQSGATGTQSTANTYVARYNTQNKIGSARVEAKTLQNVQYGRLTNNIDVLTKKPSDGTAPITYRQFQEHGAPNTVDTYFYRGTHHTTLDQMAALKARGGVVQYFGHALTYGIGPKVDAKTTLNSLPTAYGLASNESTIGNFVQAQYDMAGGTVTGSIYNFINKDVANKPDDFVRQDLVTFTGNVVGNTVIGTSANLANLEAGSLTASFYGADANEIGGSVSYIPRELGYSTPKWGAVFGATKGTSIENFNVIEQGR